MQTPNTNVAAERGNMPTESDLFFLLTGPGENFNTLRDTERSGLQPRRSRVPAPPHPKPALHDLWNRSS